MSDENPYLTGSIPQLFINNALPIIMVMVVNGLLNVVDAFYLGRFVGPDALTAVTLVFPLFMVLVASASLVSAGTASILARRLGAGDLPTAQRTFAAAQRLTVMVSLVLVMLFFLSREPMLSALANGDARLAEMGNTYILPLVLFAPATFVLNLQYDTLRSEGRVALMTRTALMVTGLNIIFNFVLINIAGLGVLGSSLGTILAQAVALATVLRHRLTGKTRIRAFSHCPFPDWETWREIVRLGLPSALNFIGVSLLSVVVISRVQTYADSMYAETIAAYGVISRLNAFSFLPLLGLSLAAQAIIGNNVGAGAYARSNAGLRVALGFALGYCAVIELIMILGAKGLGAIFVSDPMVIDEVGRILPVTISLFFFFGMNTVLAGYFQALGEARRAAIFSLAQIYLFTAPLTFLLPHLIGEWGIWIAAPAGHFSMALLGATVLFITARQTGRRFGVFLGDAKAPAQAHL